MQPISHIDTQNGILYFRGRNAVHLAQNKSYEEVLFLLVNGRVPNEEETWSLRRRMSELRHIAQDNGVDFVKQKDAGGLPQLALKLENFSKAHRLDTHDTLLLFVTMIPVVVAAEWRRKLHGESPILAGDTLSHTENFPWILDERERTPKWNKDFQTCIVLHMDDPDNPSLTALTNTYAKKGSISAALNSAIDEHVQPLHHGAGEHVMQMAREIEHPSKTRETIERQLDRGERIFGLGHRIYRTIDPRAVHLSEILHRLTIGTELEWIYDVIKSISQVGPKVIKERKGITVFPNVDLYNAAVYCALGLPETLNTYLFAISRAAGWMAHIVEYEKKEDISGCP
ncbi:citrate/2-methylcitrate synthase [Thermodesulfobacteriota bacterium]